MGFAQFLGAAVGGVGGFLIGGPLGAAAGAQIGSQLGGGFEKQKLAKGIAKQQQQLGQQQLQLGKDVAQQQLQAGQQAAQQFQPFQEAGQEALAERQALLGFGTPQQVQLAQSRVTDNPAFQFALQQGERGIERAAAARGRLNSGRTLLQLRDQNATLAAGAFNQRLGQLQAPIQQGFGASQGIAGALTGAAGLSGQFQTQGGAQNVAAQQGAFNTQIAGQQAGQQGISGAISTGITGLQIAGAFDQKPEDPVAAQQTVGAPANFGSPQLGGTGLPIPGRSPGFNFAGNPNVGFSGINRNF